MKDPAAHVRAALLLFAVIVLLLVLLASGLAMGLEELDLDAVFGSSS